MTPKEQLIESLRLLCDSEGGYRAVADKAGLDDQSVYQVISGVLLPSGNPKGVGPAMQAKLSKAFPGWDRLYFGNKPNRPGIPGGYIETYGTSGSRVLDLILAKRLSGGSSGQFAEWEREINDYHAEDPQDSNPAIDLENNPDFPAIRRVRFKLSAGVSGFAIEYLDDEGAPIVFQRQWYESRGLNPAKLFAVKVANGSMEPGLYDGDTVVVNTESTTLKDGVVFAVNYEGELVIKRLVRDAGQWWLTSDNPDQRRYQRKVCHEETKIIGEIVHKQSERI